jgi:hypothetical protein
VNLIALLRILFSTSPRRAVDEELGRHVRLDPAAQRDTLLEGDGVHAPRALLHYAAVNNLAGVEFGEVEDPVDDRHQGVARPAQPGDVVGCSSARRVSPISSVKSITPFVPGGRREESGAPVSSVDGRDCPETVWLGVLGPIPEPQGST